MSNQKKTNEGTHSIPLFRKVDDHSNNEKNICTNIHKNSHCLEDFQKELNNLHIDAQNQYEKICQNRGSHETQENFPEDFMDPKWFARQTENRRKLNFQKQPEETIITLSSTSHQNKRNNFPKQPIEKFFPMGTMSVSTNKRTLEPNKQINKDEHASSLSFEFHDTKKKQQDETFVKNNNKNTRKREPSLTLYEEYERNQKKKNLSKQLKNKFTNAQASNKIIRRKKSEYRLFLKWNLAIFITALINIFIILLICFFYLRTRIYPDLQISPNATTGIYQNFIIMSILFAYQIASLHCGYAIIRNFLIKMKKTTIVLLYPFLLIVIFIVGFICEIPYFIYSCFQLENDIPEN